MARYRVVVTVEIKSFDHETFVDADFHDEAENLAIAEAMKTGNGSFGFRVPASADQIRLAEERAVLASEPSPQAYSIALKPLGGHSIGIIGMCPKCGLNHGSRGAYDRPTPTHATKPLVSQVGVGR